MISACAKCLVMKLQVSPLNESEVSHGLCREHELETLAASGLASVQEAEELAQLRAGYVELTVRVPGLVADRLRDLGAALERETRRPVDLRLVGGLALARDLNRADYEKVPLTVYQLAPRAVPETP